MRRLLPLYSRYGRNASYQMLPYKVFFVSCPAADLQHHHAKERGAITASSLALTSWTAALSLPTSSHMRYHRRASCYERIAYDFCCGAHDDNNPATMDNSPLSLLPAELRNYIYSLAMTWPDPICIVRNPEASIILFSVANSSAQRNVLALTETCIGVRQNTRSMFSATNDFIVEDQLLGKGPPVYSAFLENLVHDSPAILRSLDIYLEPPDKCKCPHHVVVKCEGCRATFELLQLDLRPWLLKNPQAQVRVSARRRIRHGLTFQLNLRELTESWLPDESELDKVEWGRRESRLAERMAMELEWIRIAMLEKVENTEGVSVFEAPPGLP